MDDSKDKAVQYWKQVHTVGSVVFNDVSNQADSLQILLNIVANGQLLSEIECLCEDVKTMRAFCPFSSWLLQGIFVSAIANEREAALEELCVQSQSKILTAAFDRSYREYHYLISKYLAAIKMIMKVQMNTDFNCFLDEDYTLQDVTLSRMSLVISSVQQRKRLLKLLFRAVEGTYKDCIQGCHLLSYDLWELIYVLSKTGKTDLIHMTLRITRELLQSNHLPENEDIVSQLLFSLTKLLSCEWLSDQENQGLFVEVWQSLKNLVSLSNEEVDRLLQSLSNGKKSNSIRFKIFVASEINWLLSTRPHLNDIPSLNVSWDLQEQCLLLEGFIVKEILAATQKEEWTSEKLVSVIQISKNWQDLMMSLQDMLLKSIASKAKINMIADVAKTATRVLAQVEKSLSPSKGNFHFFDEKFTKILIMISQHVGEFEVACSAFAYLMNLPEAGTLPEICYRDQLKAVVNILTEPPTSINGDGISNLLRGLRNIPLGVQPEVCTNLFVRYATSPYKDVSASKVAAESVPFLFLSGKASATHLIADILMPIILSDREDFQHAAVEATSHLVCAVAGTVDIFREDDELPVIKCSECSSTSRSCGTRGSVNTIENHLKQLFIPIFTAPPAVKCRFLSLIPKLSTHLICLRSSGIFEKFLKFLSDPSCDVRREFSNCVDCLIFGRPLIIEGQLGEFSQPLQHLSSDPTHPAMTALNTFFDKLSVEINSQISTEQWGERLQTLLATLVNVACFPSRVVLKQSIQMLMLFMGVCPIPLSSFVSSIAVCHKTTPLVLYYKYRPEISEFLGRLIIRNNVKVGCPAKITLASIFFKGLSKVGFAIGSGQYIVAALVQIAGKQEQMKTLLLDYAEYFEEPVSSVITKTFSYVYTKIWLSGDPSEFKQYTDLMEQLISVKIPDLVQNSQKVIIHQLLFHYHQDANNVLKGLSQVIGGHDSSKKQIAICLESRFVGYLLFLVGKFTKEENAESEQVQALESLTAVLDLMGETFVTPVARKVLATLITMHSLDHCLHASLLCKAWKSFVRVVKTKHLGPLLATIVVTVLSLLDHDESGVLDILKYLLIEQKDKMEQYVSTLIFIKNWSPATKPIADSIGFQSGDFKDRLSRETTLATHETVGVRVEGLKALLSTFKSSAAEIQSLIIGSDETDKCVTTLWEALLMGCRDPDQRISYISSLCLGELGALDPSLLPRLLKSRNTLPLSAHDSHFGYLALNEILRGFQNARTSVDMDAFAIGIQELLKIYSVSESQDNAIWLKFSSADHSLLRPMLSSRYTVQAPIRDHWPNVIFGDPSAGSHILWATLWASKLISCCSDSKAVVLFRACEPSMKRDPKILLFFLKYILLHVITQDTVAHHSSILLEMDLVISLSSDYSAPQENGTFLPVRTVEYCGYPSIRTSMSYSDARACAMTVFFLVDFLNYWIRSFRSQNHTTSGDHLKRKDYCLVQEFLNKIDLKKVALANFELQEYPRTIQCVEDIMRKDPSNWSELLHVLSKSYALHGDLDSVGGARTLQKSVPNIEEQLFYRQMSRQLEEARILYEQLGKSDMMSPKLASDMIHCYLQLGEPTVAYSCIRTQIQQRPELAPVHMESMAECMLKLGDWSALAKTIGLDISQEQRSWFIQFSRIALNLKDGFYSEVDKLLKTSRGDLIENFTSLGADSGNEQCGYNHLIRLQILNEVERVRTVAAIKDADELNSSLEAMFKEWEAKVNLVQSSGDCLEQVLSTRRTLLGILASRSPECSKKYINEELGKYWVKSAEVARKAGCYHQAYNYIVTAEQFNIPLTFIEKSKLLWDKGCKEESLVALTDGMSTYFPDASSMKTLQSGSAERLEERKLAAEALLLYAVYNEETSNCSSSTNKTNYQEAYEVCRELEKTQAMLAQCMDRCLSLLGDSEEDEKKACEFRMLMVNYFGKSLLNGCEYIYQTVPRMLSIWFDLGENENFIENADRRNAMNKINKLIKAFAERLPPFVFMTALPQLFSRIAHPNREVFTILKYILVSLIRAFPQQCLWAIQTLAKSSIHERSFRYKEIIQDKALQTDGLSKLIQDFTALCDKLNRLTNTNLPQDSTNRGLLVSNVMRDLPQLFKSDKFSPIIVPITRFCTISLPKDVSSSTHQPFPKNPVTIAGIQNEMTVLPSLQRPRKISFLGTDGKYYDILCKPKDDLRRDARLMEFNNIVNMYLHRDPESRARQLHLRTYVVTPLGESGGLLEWVPQLVGLRPALFQLYKQNGQYVPPRDVRKFETTVKDSITKKREMLVDKLLPLHPPIFHEWFRLTFPDPAGWYAARLAYIRTTAVISMVGYILGLGDRHGENILFDCESGDTVHVDFNCLFNKGEQFLFKERVPFRLTHNMVAAMGPCGVEGTFRKSCEISMRVLRAQGKTLMSVLTPSAYDPFGSWGKNKQIIKQERDQKIAEALEELRDIEKRLNGSLRVKQKNDTFYLSVEGLVRSLITEATSIENLCQMYLGWGAYL